MKLKEKDYQLFKTWAMKYFSEDFDEGYNPYWDEYMRMYSDFSDMYPHIKKYMKLKDKNEEVGPLAHIELINLIKDIEEIIYDYEYEEIVNDKGGDRVYVAYITPK